MHSHLCFCGSDVSWKGELLSREAPPLIPCKPHRPSQTAGDRLADFLCPPQLGSGLPGGMWAHPLQSLSSEMPRSFRWARSCESCPSLFSLSFSEGSVSLRLQAHSCLCTHLRLAGSSADLGWALSFGDQLAVGWDKWAFFQGCSSGKPTWGYVHGSWVSRE